MNENNAWIYKILIKPVKEKLSEKRAIAKDPLSKFYYTGGLGIEISFFHHQFSDGIADDLIDDEINSSFLLSVFFQYKRIAFTFYSMINNDITFNDNFFSSESADYNTPNTFYDFNLMGVTLGFVVLDNRHLKIEPFIGYSSRNNSDDAGEYGLMSFEGFSFGSTIDVRLYSKINKYHNIDEIRGLSTLSLRLRYIGTLGNVKLNDYSWDNSLYNTFSIGLSFFMW